MNFRELVEVEDATTCFVQTLNNSEGSDFGSLMLRSDLVSGLSHSGFKSPTPLQLACIPVGKLGEDLIVEAKSGTGKTTALVILCLETMDLSSQALQCLVMAPTREMATMIYERFLEMGKSMSSKGLRVGLFIGGTALSTDKWSLDEGVHIAVGTPGRLWQLRSEGLLELSAIRLFALDEAGQLRERQYKMNIRDLSSHMPASKQVAVFSAHFPDILNEFLGKAMESPTLVRLNDADVQSLDIKQFLWTLSVESLGDLVVASQLYLDSIMRKKIEALLELLRRVAYKQCLIFCNYQGVAETVATVLGKVGQRAELLTAQLDTQWRAEVVSLTKPSDFRILVSTDLAARGLDLPNLDLVVSLETPGDPETYVHRVRRAGLGAAVTLVVDMVDSKRFHAICCAGAVRCKILPSIYSAPVDLCSSIEFWDSAEFIPMPASEQTTGKACWKPRKPRSVIAVPPSPRSDRIDAGDLKDAKSELFSQPGMSEPSERPAEARYTRDELLSIAKQLSKARLFNGQTLSSSIPVKEWKQTSANQRLQYLKNCIRVGFGPELPGFDFTEEQFNQVMRIQRDKNLVRNMTVEQVARLALPVFRQLY